MVGNVNFDLNVSRELMKIYKHLVIFTLNFSV